MVRKINRMTDEKQALPSAALCSVAAKKTETNRLGLDKNAFDALIVVVVKILIPY